MWFPFYCFPAETGSVAHYSCCLTLFLLLLFLFFFSFSMQSSVVGGNEDKKSVNEGALARMDLFSVELNRGTVRI